MFFLCVVIFFFKQKTAYEMRISDWSSDVCSSDLQPAIGKREFDAVATQQHQLALDPGECRKRAVGVDLGNRQPHIPIIAGRSEERRVGKECVSTCRSRWLPYH